MDAGRSLSVNQLFASSAHQQAVQQLRLQDAAVRTDALRKAAGAGAGAATVTNLTYSLGPDGQLYATGGTVSTSKRVRGDALSAKLTPRNDNAVQDSLNRPQRQPNRQARFGDFLPPQLALSPLDLALLQESRDNPLAVAELTQIDAAVRSHERQHFFTAGGLAAGVPEYQYAIGPDGRLYAVGGHVDVATTPTTDPTKAARDGAALARAATAPADSSAQDVSVARGSLSNAASLYSQANRLGLENTLDMVA